MRSIRWAALCLAAAAMPALAQFEGVLEMKMSMKEGGTGTGKTYVSKTGWRSEMEMQLPKMEKTTGKASMKMTMLGKLSDPDKMYTIDDERKTYAVIDVKKVSEMAGKQAEETYTVKKLGGDTVAGYGCEKVLITSSKGNEIEGCATREIMGSSAWLSSLQRGRGGAYGGWVRALKEAGVGEVLIRFVIRDKSTKEETMRMELVKAEKKSLSPSLFEIPPGYKETDMMGMAMGQMSPEQQEKMKAAQEQMKKAMENMTPEQKKMMEDMMKQRSGNK
jgi:hypothetical protein